MIARHCFGIMLLVFMVLFFTLQSPAADLTFYVGGINPGSIEYNGENVSLDSGPVFGFRLWHDFVPSFGMEHTIAFSSDFLYPQNFEGVTDANGFIYNSNFIFGFTVKKFVPYLTAGIGLISQYGSSNLPVGTKPAFNYGGGLKFPRIKGCFGARFDVRGVSAGFVSNNVNMLEMSGGLLISLGK